MYEKITMRKIEMIKFVRTVTTMGLREAKELVEALFESSGGNVDITMHRLAKACALGFRVMEDMAIIQDGCLYVRDGIPENYVIHRGEAFKLFEWED